MIVWAAPLPTSQMMPPIARHCQNISSKAALESNTYVLLSTGSGTKRVHARLNHGRAMMLCCSANSASKPPSIAKATQIEPAGLESIDFGTPKFSRDGYLLDSGSLNRLWFCFRLGLGVNNPIQRNRLDCDGLLRKAEEEFTAAL